MAVLKVSWRGISSRRPPGVARPRHENFPRARPRPPLTPRGNLKFTALTRGCQTNYFLYGAPENHDHYGLSIFFMDKQ